MVLKAKFVLMPLTFLLAFLVGNCDEMYSLSLSKA